MRSLARVISEGSARRFEFRFAATAACLLLAQLSGCSKSAPPPEKAAEPEQSHGLALSSEEIKALGITTVPARAADYRASVDGFGVVTSLETFAQTYADVETASAAAAQSQAAVSRARTLAAGADAAVSREVLEGAESKAAADQAALALAQRKSETVFGLSAPWRLAADRKRIMDQLAQGRAVLVHVTFPLGRLGGSKPEEINIARIGPQASSWHTKQIWPAPADPTVPGNGYFVLLEGSDLAQGEHVAATTGVGEKLKGVWIPQSALLLSESNTWAYVETTVGHYRRVAIDLGRPDDAGYVLASDAGIAPDQKVVVIGAGLLLAHELNPSGAGGD
jgi:hypothetical protein